MIFDFQASFTASASGISTPVVGAAGTYLAPNTIDTGPLAAYLTELTAGDTQLSANVNAGRDINANRRLQLVINILTAAAGGTSADFQLITSDTPDLASPVVITDYGVVATAGLTRGTRFKHTIASSALYKRYLGLQVVSVGTFTALAYAAGLVLDASTPTMGYASGYAIK